MPAAASGELKHPGPRQGGIAVQVAEIASVEVLLIMAAVGLLVFGSAKLPKIARGLGSARSEFERGLKEGDGSTSSP
jgi:TatA/E family protein of Tat protein translocase